MPWDGYTNVGRRTRIIGAFDQIDIVLGVIARVPRWIVSRQRIVRGAARNPSDIHHFAKFMVSKKPTQLFGSS